MFRRTGLLLAFTAALAVLVSVGGVSGATSSGITRDYEIVVTRKKISPDGVEKTIVGADVFSKDAGSRSGSTKAPLISDWYPVMKGSKNDLFRFKVTNNLTTTKMYDEIRRSSPRGAIGGPVGRALHDAKGPATSIHLHGLGFSDGHQFYDGPAFITQCPIKAGKSFQYETLLSAGTNDVEIGHTWWHSHMQLQYTDGLLGALMIDDPNSPHKGKWDEEVIIILSDHWHLQSEEVLMLRFDPAGPAVWGPKGDPLIPDSFFINGKGRFNCSNPVPKGMKCNSNQPWPEFKFTKGKRYLLRIINAATASAFWFSIDNHPLHVVQADHTWTRKATFDRIFVDVAQRYSVIVEATSHPRSLAWMRADFEFAYYPAPAPLLPKSTFGIVRYEKASKTKEPTSIAKRKPKSLGMNGELQLVPFNAKPAPPVGQKMRIKYALNFTTFRWEMNGKGFMMSTTPTLSKILSGTPLNATDLTFPLTAAPGKSVELILENQDVLFPHPIHIHGHTFAVLGAGKGAWDEKYRAKLNLKNPMRRDTVHMDNPGWVVLRITVDNPGVWLAHCHKQWHVEMGLAWTFSEMLGKVKKLKVPEGWKELCDA